MKKLNRFQLTIYYENIKSLPDNKYPLSDNHFDYNDILYEEIDKNDEYTYKNSSGISNGIMLGIGNSYGNGEGSGIGYGDGTGEGSGIGSGLGNGTGYGIGRGSGDGTGFGDGWFGFVDE